MMLLNLRQSRLFVYHWQLSAVNSHLISDSHWALGTLPSEEENSVGMKSTQLCRKVRLIFFSMIRLGAWMFIKQQDECCIEVYTGIDKMKMHFLRLRRNDMDFSLSLGTLITLINHFNSLTTCRMNIY